MRDIRETIGGLVIVLIVLALLIFLGWNSVARQAFESAAAKTCYPNVAVSNDRGKRLAVCAMADGVYEVKEVP